MLSKELIAYLDDLLQINHFRDYAPQGLQIEGNQDISTIVTAVTASLQAIEFSCQVGADMLLVHHGLFWRNEQLVITNWKQKRIKKLLASNINLVSYHLPLDAHRELGNNIQLAKIMDWQCNKIVGEQNLLYLGQLKKISLLSDLQIEIENRLMRKSLVIGNPNREVFNIAWCTGGGQNFFLQAIAEGVDAFITGEASEAQYHYAQESNVAFISAGHHVTEKYGIKALGEHVKQQFNLKVIFFDEKNPI